MSWLGLIEFGYLAFGIGALSLLGVIFYIKRLYLKQNTVTGQTVPVTPSPTPPTTTVIQPASPPTPKAKKGYGWLWWLLVIVIAIILTWEFSTSWGKSKVIAAPAASTGMQVVIPKEVWTFRWITTYESHPLSVEVVENRNGIFRAVLHDINGHGKDERVAGLTMRWEGKNLLGTWTDYADGQGGNAYLYYSDNNQWSGWWECNNATTKVHIEMNKK